MQARQINFGVITALAITVLTAMMVAQTKARAEDAAKYPAFRVKAEGDGRAIIMIPGLASSGTTWDATAEHLSKHFRCIQLTLAGFAAVPPIQKPLLTEAREQIAQYIRVTVTIKGIVETPEHWEQTARFEDGSLDWEEIFARWDVLFAISDEEAGDAE
jgi:pimeloyl-ACP methyl ester carboxylesterase